MSGNISRGTSASATQVQQETGNNAASSSDGTSQGQRFASLYRGRTTFSYAASRRPNPNGTAKTRAMTGALTRRRTGKGGVHGDDSDSGSSEEGTDSIDGSRAPVSRSGSGGDGGNQHGERHDRHEASVSAEFKPSKGNRNKTPSTRLLDASAAAGENDETRGAAFHAAWCVELVDLVKRTQRPGTSADKPCKELMKLMNVRRLAEQRYGRLPPPQLTLLTDIPPPPSGMKSNALPAAARTFNLLVALQLLNAAAPLTRQQQAHAIRTLSVLCA